MASASASSTMRALLAVDARVMAFSSRFCSKHQVKAGFDFLLARDADQLAFLSRSIGDASGVFACLTFQIRLGDGQTSLYAVDGGQHIAAHGADAGIQIDYHRVVFLGGTEQALAFQQASRCSG